MNCWNDSGVEDGVRYSAEGSTDVDGQYELSGRSLVNIECCHGERRERRGRKVLSNANFSERF